MSESDFGVWISTPGTSVINAKPKQLLMDTSYPFLKIDTQNKVGFQTITLIINTDPPEPTAGGANTYTVVKSFAHGYKYIPEVEMLCYVQTPPPGQVYPQFQTYFQDYGRIGAATGGSAAALYAIADATNVYLVVEKSRPSGGSTNLLSGTNLLITLHVFVEDLLS